MSVDTGTFKEIVSHFLTGITVVTTHDGSAPLGMTVNSFTSVCVEPPIISIGLDKQRSIYASVELSRTFIVNILHVDQVQVGINFAQAGLSMADRFAASAWTAGLGDCPILDGCLAWLACVVDHSHAVGDHVVFFARVVDGRVLGKQMPLGYFHRNWISLSPESPIIPT